MEIQAVMLCCSKCDNHLGTLLNLWIQMDEGHMITLVSTTVDFWGISQEGPVRLGKLAVVDTCHVQDIVCNQCRSSLGSKCISSAVNHVLHQGQLLLRISSVQIKNPSNSSTIQPIILRILKRNNQPAAKSQSEGDDHGLRDDFSYRQAANNNSVLNHILQKIDTQGEKIERLDTACHQAVTSVGWTMQHTNDEVRRSKFDISSNAAEIKETQNHLEQESTSIRDTIVEANTSLRTEYNDKWERHQQRFNLLEPKLENALQELKELKTLLESTRTAEASAPAASAVNTEEMTGLMAELRHLRHELSLERSRRSHSTNPPPTARGTDTLTGNITKTANTANRTKPPLVDLKVLKEWSQSIRSHGQKLQHSQPIGLKRKAASDSHTESGSSVAQNTGNSPPAPPTTHSTPLPSATKAPRNVASAGIPKLTKSGAVDERILERSSSESASKPAPSPAPGPVPKQRRLIHIANKQ
ncbi:hypothetical protein F5Y10DRAFT_72768 [Nemania abortiva]|nr:hypothetical protein F5Y10DRAFT_72768 [Nemania abortiva]